uniref:ATP synthase complex subunit 8 n=1 Tax=Gymnopis multiplicata TaxID=449092 RepID=C9D8G3_GYMMU|nr:ATP synthase F0 subunit 8 [Gymnopis multiplicata]ACS37096.1 ATP synthase F0 subunit 8 [Gymnopis multiplicata]
MPQLNPYPWFMIMMTSWIIILITIMKKTTVYQQMNTITQKHPYKQYPTWTWPW